MENEVPLYLEDVPFAAQGRMMEQHPLKTSGYCPILHTTHQPKIALQNGTVLLGVDFPVSMSANSLCWYYHPT